MADDKQHDDSNPTADGTPTPEQPGDETASMQRDEMFGGDEAPSAEDDATTPLAAGGQDVPDADATTVLPAGGRSDNGVTEKMSPAHDATSIMPPASDPWTGRAGVPAGEGHVRDSVPPESGYPGEPRRVWWAPVLIGALVLFLLGVMAVAVWFALRKTPAVVPTLSPTPVATSQQPSVAPTPTASVPPSVTAVPQLVPQNLVGMPQQQAIDALTALGLNPEIEYRPSDSADSGTVLDVSPKPGTLVQPGSTVRLIVAVPAPSSAAPSPSLSPAGPSPSD